MKTNFFKKAALLLLVSVSAAAQAQEVKFHTGKWADAITMAAPEQRLIMVDAYTDWCGWCKVMDKKTFTDPRVADMLNSRFIAVKKEMEKEADGQKLAMKYHVNSFPTILFFTHEGKLIYVSHGYEPADDFLKTLDKVANLASEPPADDMRVHEMYNVGKLEPGFPDFYKASFQVADKRPKVDEKKVSLFLDEQKDKTSEVCWGVLWRFSSLSVCQEVVLKEYANLKSLYGREAVEEVTASIISRRANAAIKEKNKENYQLALNLMDKYMSDDAEKENLRTSLQMSYFKSLKDWAGYAGVMQPIYEKSGADASGWLNQAAWTIYEECDDQVVLKQAAGWMRVVTDAHPEYMYLDTYAALLYKTKDYTAARSYAELAITDGEKNGEDVSSTKSLLEMIKVKLK
jgi:thioredoxin-related protein